MLTSVAQSVQKQQRAALIDEEGQHELAQQQQRRSVQPVCMPAPATVDARLPDPPVADEEERLSC